ncbi:MAG: nucleotide sugar dehydrogenase [Beijerinckiaceae bacterium]|nr:nucleotide sugar dehydrogenase [Beijerinckiaceae bacterium]MCI0736786.1 nucleotide sugar dehydrogenase [Beijerinckiaceae bacterium]
MSVEALLAKYKGRTAIVAVVGLGYVGLPLVRALLAAGFRVIGLDIDAGKIEALKRGEAYISHSPAKLFARAIVDGRFNPTTAFRDLHEADAILICVPTPLTRHREPDLSFVENTARSILPHLRAGQLIILESTSFPGTTRDIVKPILQQSKLESGKDFFIAFSPEREDPGNIMFSTNEIPKVVGGDGEDALKLADALYSSFVCQTVPVSNLETAEAVKITENIFRSVNIALVNELKVLYAAMGIDVWDVIEAAKTKPFGFMAFYPGPGLGGHCIPIDPFYLTWKAREYGLATRFIELAGEINTMMPQYVVSRIVDELNARTGRGLNGTKILVIGLAYKKNIDDTRESPSFKLIELLEKQGAVCEVHDPFVSTIPSTREHPKLAGRRSVALNPEVISAFDAVLITTDHDSIDYKLLVRSAKIVIDTRNACARAGAIGSNIVKA